MPLLTVTNLRTSLLTLQDLAGTISLSVPGSTTITDKVVSDSEFAALEPQLKAGVTASNITWSVKDNPNTLADDVPMNVTTVLATPHAAAADAQLLVTDLTIAGAVAVNLPAAAPIGHAVIVCDGKGDAAANNVTIAAVGGTINGGANVVINVNRGVAFLYKTAANVWKAVLSSVVSAGAAGGDLAGTYPNPTLAAIFASAPQALAGPGAVNVTSPVTLFTSTGVADALTLANGTKTGQYKYIMHTVDGGSGVLTPATPGNFSTITLTNRFEWALLQWSGAAWNVIAATPITIIAP